MTDPLDDALRDSADEFNDQPDVPVRLVRGTITALAPNAARDTPTSTSPTRPLVTVTMPDGSTQEMQYNADTTLANGAVVLVLLNGAYPTLLCRLSGFPPND